MSVPVGRFDFLSPAGGTRFFFLFFWHLSGEILGKVWAASKVIFPLTTMTIFYWNQALHGLLKIAAYKILRS